MNRIQEEDLKILKEFHNFCEEHNLQYLLYAGTLLGAIRHKGYIPWDDDVDVMMTREEFERFEDLYLASDYKSKGLDYQSNKTYKYYAGVITKIRSNTLDVRENVPKSQGGNYGPWVDIFPYDNVPDDPELRYKQFKKVMYYNRLIRVFLLAKVTPRDKGIKRFIKQTQIKINDVCYKAYFFVPYLFRQRHKYMTMYNDTETKFKGDLAYNFYNTYDHYLTTLFENDEFNNTEKAPFEDGEFYIPTNYDMILTRYFGDYMQLPPEEERKVHDIYFVE